MTVDWSDCLAASLIGIVSFICLIVYIFISYIILANPKEFSSNSYYKFALCLALGDCIQLAIFLFYSTPATFVQGKFLGPFWEEMLGILCNWAYFSCLTAICVIAINRYCAVCRFSTYQDTFSPKRTMFLIAGIWIMGAIFAAPQMIPKHRIKFFSHVYKWGYDEPFHYNGIVANTVTVTTLILTYKAIFTKRRQVQVEAGGNCT